MFSTRYCLKKKNFEKKFCIYKTFWLYLFPIRLCRIITKRKSRNSTMPTRNWSTKQSTPLWRRRKNGIRSQLPKGSPKSIFFEFRWKQFDFILNFGVFRLKIWEKAASLMANEYRAKLNAATMLGQAKTVIQAEIDSAAELIDFFRQIFLVAFRYKRHVFTM